MVVRSVLRHRVVVGAVATEAASVPLGSGQRFPRNILPWLFGPALYSASKTVEENLLPIMGIGE